MRRLMAMVPMLMLCACDDPPATPPSIDGGVALEDSDGDSISDLAEGVVDAVDTDRDGSPDFRDTDSDGDGISDADEAGDARLDSDPFDSDGDGTPDFRDTDSDNNGLGDRQDGTGDLDQDFFPDFRDPDDDGDQVPDTVELGDPNSPRDSDGDRTPDYRDADSDGDTILDVVEGTADTDKDGLADRVDQDSDNDEYTDAEEAGDRDPNTPPVDTDDDGIPDYRDPDSDNDGLADVLEAAARLSRVDADTDRDGVSDLIEVAARTDGADRNDNPQARGDFVFVVPFEETPVPSRDTLSFETNFRQVDLYFAFDVTTSMNAEMEAMRNVQSGVPAIIAELQCEVSNRPCTVGSDCLAGERCSQGGVCQEDPATDDCLPDIWTGLGAFTELDSYRNLVSLQADAAVTARAIPMTSAGRDEAPLQVPACVADGANCLTALGVGCVAAPNRVGCPGFRADAVRMYLQITDADDQCFGDRCAMFDAAFAGQALQGKGIRFISLVGTDDSGGVGTPRSIAEDIGRAAGTLGADGNPLVFDAIDAEVVRKATDAVRSFVDNEFEVRIFAENTEGNAIRFIDYLEVRQSATNPACPAFHRDGLTPVVAADTDPDTLEPSGRPDTRRDYFPSLDPGVPVCWDVVPLRNTGVRPTRTPQVFLARLAVRAAGSVVDERDVYFLVPPVIPDPGSPI